MEDREHLVNDTPSFRSHILNALDRVTESFAEQGRLIAENSRQIHKAVANTEVAKAERRQIINRQERHSAVQKEHGNKIAELEAGQGRLEQHISDRIDNGLTSSVAQTHEELSQFRVETREIIVLLSKRIWTFAVVLGGSGAVLGGVVWIALRVLKVLP